MLVALPLLNLFVLALDLNTPYTGPFDRIERGGKNLWENGRIWKFNSVNCPTMHTVYYPIGRLYGFNTCQRRVVNVGTNVDNNGYLYGTEWGQTCIVPKSGDRVDYSSWVPRAPVPQEQEDLVMSVRGMGGKVIRSYTIGLGTGYHVSAPNTFTEEFWVGLDQALVLARKHGIRLILPIINDHQGGDYSNSDGLGGAFGDYQIMARWRGKLASQFWTDPQLIQDFKDVLKFMLLRKNTINGIVYKDDPTILAWETGNELGGWGGPSPPASWTIEMANYIKSIAPNNLVMDGSFGGLDARGNDRFRGDALAHPNVDIFSNHYYYGYDDIARSYADVNLVTSYGKVFIIGEMGWDWSTMVSLYNQVATDDRFTGAMIWSLRGHDKDGGHQVHGEGYGVMAYHCPGFPQKDSFSDWNDDKVVKFIRDINLKMAGLDANTAPPNPGYGRPIDDSSISPTNLKWFGSSWALTYRIFRRSSQDLLSPSAWKLINSNVQDNVVPGQTIYSDYTTQSGLYYWYLIQPVALDQSADYLAALQIGPFKT